MSGQAKKARKAMAAKVDRMVGAERAVATFALGEAEIALVAAQARYLRAHGWVETGDGSGRWFRGDTSTGCSRSVDQSWAVQQQRTERSSGRNQNPVESPV